MDAVVLRWWDTLTPQGKANAKGQFPEQFAEVDRKKKDEIETINQADTLVYTTEKTLNDFEGKVPEAEVKEIRDKVAELKKLLEPKEKDVASVKKKLDEVTQLVQKAATELYQKAAAQKQESAEPQGEEKIVDAEVKENKKKK